MNRAKLIIKIGRIQKHRDKNQELNVVLENWLINNVSEPYTLADFEKFSKYYDSIKEKY